MKKLIEEIIKPILEANSKIKKVVGIYGGRFQPFGPHHYKTYKWLERQVDDAYITTSNIKKPPRHPMNFKEKVRHMSQMGVKANRIVEEKTPYVANNVLKKYDPETTAVVYIFGQKDAGRLSGGNKKGGGKKYYQDYKKNKTNLEGFETHGYILTAPHVSISVGGKEVSGTAMRELLGSPKIDDSERAKLFKKMFGYYNDGVFKMMTNKFKKLFKEDTDFVFKPTKIKKLKKKYKDGEDEELLKGQKINESKKEFVIWGIPPGKNSEDILYTKAKSHGEAKKVLKILTSKHGIKKGRIQILDLEQDPSAFWKSDKVFEDINIPVKVGDTVLVGKFKNKKEKVKSIGKDKHGMPTINGRKATTFRIHSRVNIFDDIEEDIDVVKKKGKDGGDYREYKSNKSKWKEPYKHIDEFLEIIDFKELIKEATGNVSADDGPNFFYPKKHLYKNRGNKEAEKLGWGVVNYILGDDYDIPEDFPIYPDGPVKSVSYLPAGVGTGKTPNHQEEYVGSQSWSKWLQHMKKLSQLVGYELIDFLTDREDVIDTTIETPKQQKQEEPQETKPKKDLDQHKDMESVKEHTLSKGWWKKQLLQEGGAYGHMAHPFDDKDLTFGDLKKIIELGLGGQLNREDNVTEKLDGQNIMISWKDGKLIAARNKGHIKNGGKTALDAKGIASKFKGRGDIRNAFVFAMRDLEKSIKGLSQKQKDKIFNNGYNFMNMEVMWPKSANVIDYDVATLIFHGALQYDDNGNVKGEVKGSGRILAGMIQQINQHIQKKYTIGKPVFLEVPKHQDFGKMKGKFKSRLTKLQSKFGLGDNDTLALYHQKWWESFINKNIPGISPKVIKGLVKRWAFFDKSYGIRDIKNDISYIKLRDIVLKFDKEDHTKQVKENMKPFETLFFEVGAEILKNVKGFIAANPDKAVQGIRKRLDKAISNVRKGGDLKKLNTLKLQLDKLNAIGGVDSIVPSEGIVFKYNGKTYKFTGAFAPINQITGLISF